MARPGRPTPLRGAFLTLDDPAGYTIDDHLAVAPLARLGWSIDHVPWRHPDVEWTAYDAVVIRSTWDYAKDPDAFLAVLTGIMRAGVRLFNPLALVEWNLRKTYMRDLAGRGVPIVPTAWLERLERGSLRELVREVGADEIVVKPVIGASARGAFRLAAEASDSVASEVESYYAHRALLAQPFVRAIPEEGEHSLFYFDGEYSHAIEKRRKAAVFRVQEEHGGSSVPVRATPQLLATGARVLASLDATPLYARVDLVRANDSDGYWLMELELIEPSLYLRLDDEAPERFARALHARMTGDAPELPRTSLGEPDHQRR
jgi:glutathione synthase/RimK-type ligase-like ATP-grasp enzyme